MLLVKGKAIYFYLTVLYLLGGGLGGTRRGGADVNIKHSGRDDASRYDDRAIGGYVLHRKTVGDDFLIYFF